MELALAAPLGLIIGSFLNVVTYRLPRGESLLWPSSHCPGCGTPVKTYDNVPVVSWLILRGRCRSCGERISPRYPLIELVTALAFAAIVLARGVHPALALELPFAAMLIAIAGIDFEHLMIPNRILLPLAVWALGAGAVLTSHALPSALIAGTGAFTFLLLFALAYPGGMGMGDVKLAGVMGLYLGLSVVPAMLLAVFIGSLVGVVMLARGGLAARKTRVPFGVFLALGSLIALAVGPQLVHFYTHTFLR